jgi:hypothetical protein
MPKTLLSLAALLAFAFASAGVRAQVTPDQAATASQVLNNQRVWQAEDKCNEIAWKQYPDYTKEASAKRERAFKLCQMSGQFPPRAPLTAAPVPSTETSPAR